MHSPKKLPTALAGAVLALGLAGCGYLPDVTSASDSGPSQGPATGAPVPDGAESAKTPAEALALLDQIDIKGKAPQTGYDRDKFGSGWTDTNNNDCETRDDILARDLIKIEYEGPEHCEVASGTLPYEPYSGEKNVQFDADGDYDHALDVEHIVALGNAWQTGAQQWPETKREQFANDPLNLMMADPSLNRAKGDADAATWLPPNKAYRCTYASKQTTIKATYDLWMAPAEHDKIETILTGCTNSNK